MLAIGFESGPARSAALVAGMDAKGRLAEAVLRQPIARALVQEALSLPRFCGKDQGFGAILSAYRPQGWLYLLGVGAETPQNPADQTRLGGLLVAHLLQAGPASFQIALDLEPEQLARVALGARLRFWRPDSRYKSKIRPEDDYSLKKLVFLTSEPERAESAYQKLSLLADGVDFARDLAVAPASDLSPKNFTRRLRQLREWGIDVDILDKKDLKAEKLSLLLAVGQAAKEESCLAILRWRGAKASQKPVMLVGKGICFDTGGIDIKPALHMEEMKGDMSGAAVAAATLMVAAKQKLPLNLVALLPIAENAISGNAYRPGDILKSHAGLTVEIADTDAEGRLILADALSFGAKRFAPETIIDLATLTGSVVVALGHERAGLFSNDDTLAARLSIAGEQEGEKLWRLPLTAIYDDDFASEAADICSCSCTSPAPDALHAARFLEHFVPEKTAWAHLDIAGTSEVEENSALAIKGPTGFGVRLLMRFLQDLAQQQGLVCK